MSSVLKMVEAAMSNDTEVACLWFNGWAFQGFDDAKIVLIEATISELARRRSAVGKAEEMSALRGVDWLKLARSGGGLVFTLATGLRKRRSRPYGSCFSRNLQIFSCRRIRGDSHADPGG